MITTKKGKKRSGIGISLSTGVTLGKIDKETFVEYQKNYGAGYAMPSFGYYGPDGFFEEDINGDGRLTRLFQPLKTVLTVLHLILI